jgi:L-ribulokinase
MFGAVAAGKAAGGYDSIFDAAKAAAHLQEDYYRPDIDNKTVYDRLFQEYKLLHDYFGRGENNVMKRLKAIKAETLKEKKG